MNLGTVGNSLYFFGLMIAAVMLALPVLVYLAHSFHVVLSTTAAGSDEVTWPSEPMVDWAGQALRLGFLTVLAPMPGLFLALALRRAIAHEQWPILFRALVLISFWLLFPVSLMSAYTSPVPWLPLFPPLLGRLCRRPVTALVMYVAGGLTIGVAGAAFWVVVATGLHVLLILACLVASTAILIYARLIGRWLWIVNAKYITLPPDHGRLPIVGAEPSHQPKQARKRKRRGRPRSQWYDPWEAAAEEVETKKSAAPVPDEPMPTIPAWMDVDLNPYALAADDKIEKDSAKPASQPVMEEEPLAMQPLPGGSGEPSQEEPAKSVVPESGVGDVKPDERRHGRSRHMLSGICSFPWYRTTLRSWLALALGLFGLMALLVLMVEAMPVKPG